MIILNEGNKIPPCIKKEHKWVTIKKPFNNESGWHVEKCKMCGIEIGYDDSD